MRRYRVAPVLLLLLTVGIFVCTLGAPLFEVYAQESGGLVTCNGVDCGTCEFASTLMNVFDLLLLLATFVATGLIVFSGLRLATSAGNTAAMESTKKILVNIVIGFLLVFSAYAIVNTIIGVLVPTDSPLLSWNRIQCIYATTPGDDGAFGGGTGDDSPAGGAYGDALPGAGSCTLGPSGSACDPAVLSRYFGSNASQMSGICMRESGGQPVESNLDRCCGSDGDCTNADSFSGGYFQLNILTGYEHIPGCDGSFLKFPQEQNWVTVFQDFLVVFVMDGHVPLLIEACTIRACVLCGRVM